MLRAIVPNVFSHVRLKQDCVWVAVVFSYVCLQQCKGRYEITFRFLFNGKIEPEHSRHKKILDYFIKFMSENLTCGADNLMLLSREASNDTTDVRLIRQQNCEVVSSAHPNPFL